MSADEQQSATVTTTVVPTTTSTAIFASAPNVHGRTIGNATTATLYVKFGTGASATSFTAAVPTATSFTFPAPVYAGLVEVSAVSGGSVAATQW